MRAVKENANAKINLFLDVVSKRDDGFHDIKTVMHSISLFDSITVSVSESLTTNVKLTVSGVRYIPTDSKNLAVKAALLYLERASLTANVEIKLIKRIPVAAGLAGGSSDAAAVLRAMNRLYNRLFTERALSFMALELGSDVPYCLYGKTALCEGRGEIITKLPDTLKLFTVVAIANEHMATPQAYSSLDSLYSSFDGSVSTGGESVFSLLASGIKSGELDCRGLFNVFEKAVLPICAGSSFLKKRLKELGAEESLMSGSGPSVFGIFSNKEKASLTCKALKDEGFTAFYAESI